MNLNLKINAEFLTVITLRVANIIFCLSVSLVIAQFSKWSTDPLSKPSLYYFLDCNTFIDSGQLRERGFVLLIILCPDKWKQVAGQMSFVTALVQCLYPVK